MYGDDVSMVLALSFDEQWLRGLFEAHSRDLLGYAARRLPSYEDAKDVVSEVFMVAWRRRAVVPDGCEQQRMWLYGVARRILANAQRSEQRSTRLASRLISLDEAVSPDHSINDDQSDLEEALGALAALRPNDREVLLLALWEGLSVAQIASVMGMRASNVSVRLHRAKARLRREFFRAVQDQRTGGHVLDMRAHRDVGPETSR